MCNAIVVFLSSGRSTLHDHASTRSCIYHPCFCRRAFSYSGEYFHPWVFFRFCGCMRLSFCCFFLVLGFCFNRVYWRLYELGSLCFTITIRRMVELGIDAVFMPLEFILVGVCHRILISHICVVFMVHSCPQWNLVVSWALGFLVFLEL